jgi:hypothetical protein
MCVTTYNHTYFNASPAMAQEKRGKQPFGSPANTGAINSNGNVFNAIMIVQIFCTSFQSPMH